MSQKAQKFYYLWVLNISKIKKNTFSNLLCLILQSSHQDDEVQQQKWSTASDGMETISQKQDHNQQTTWQQQHSRH